MMYFVLAHETARQRAQEAVKNAPEGWTVTIEKPKRSPPQNKIFHAICGDIAKSGLHFAGKKRTASEWKVLLVSGHAVATKQGAEVVPGIEGEFVNIRESTASMDKGRGSSLIEYTMAFCAANDIRLSANNETNAASIRNAK